MENGFKQNSACVLQTLRGLIIAHGEACAWDAESSMAACKKDGAIAKGRFELEHSLPGAVDTKTLVAMPRGMI